MKPTTEKDRPLYCEIEGQQVVIRIGISTLAFAYKNQPLPYDHPKPLKVIDERRFAHDVIYEITREREDGATPLDLFLDKMFEKTEQNGSTGLKYD